MPEEAMKFTNSILPWFVALVLTGFGTAGLWVASGQRDDMREVRQALNHNFNTISDIKSRLSLLENVVLYTDQKGPRRDGQAD